MIVWLLLLLLFYYYYYYYYYYNYRKSQERCDRSIKTGLRRIP